MGPSGESSRRERILAAAVKEFALRGYSGARMDRIASAALVNKQLLFHYFKSKAGLHRAAVERSLEQLAVGVPAQMPPAERLRRLIEQVGAAAGTHPALLSLLSSPAASAPPDARQLAREWRAGASRSAVRIFEDAQRSGYVRDDADIATVAEVIVAAALGWKTAGEMAPDHFTETLVRMALDHCAWR